MQGIRTILNALFSSHRCTDQGCKIQNRADRVPNTTQSYQLVTSAKRLLNSIALVGCFLVALGLSGCGTKNLRVNIIVEADANSNSPVIVSAVVVHSSKLLSKLQEMNATQWFQKREQMLRDYPKDLEEIYWELVPGQQVPPLDKKVRQKAIQGVLFANYRSPGAHRYLFDPKRAQEWTCGLRELKLHE